MNVASNNNHTHTHTKLRVRYVVISPTNDKKKNGEKTNYQRPCSNDDDAGNNDNLSTGKTMMTYISNINRAKANINLFQHHLSR